MTDLENFVLLYKSFGIDCIVSKTPDGIQQIILAESQVDKGSTTSEKFGGYNQFYSTVEFDAVGKFVRQGFWE